VDDAKKQNNTMIPHNYVKTDIMEAGGRAGDRLKPEMRPGRRFGQGMVVSGRGRAAAADRRAKKKALRGVRKAFGFLGVPKGI
jgi:hypothetical protein